jgi:hypothetical protein
MLLACARAGPNGNGLTRDRDYGRALPSPRPSPPTGAAGRVRAPPREGTRPAECRPCRSGETHQPAVACDLVGGASFRLPGGLPSGGPGPQIIRDCCARLGDQSDNCTALGPRSSRRREDDVRRARPHRPENAGLRHLERDGSGHSVGSRDATRGLVGREARVAGLFVGRSASTPEPAPASPSTPLPWLAGRRRFLRFRVFFLPPPSASSPPSPSSPAARGPGGPSGVCRSAVSHAVCESACSSRRLRRRSGALRTVAGPR